MATLHSSTTPQQAREDRRIVTRALKLLETQMRKPGENITGTKQVRDYLRLLLVEEEREVFVCLFLNTQHRLIEVERMFYGTLTHTSVYPREVVKRSLHHNAAAVIFAHNHPSGLAEPSKADLQLTSALKEALQLVDVQVLDHIVVGGSAAVSLAELGQLGVAESRDQNQGATLHFINKASDATHLGLTSLHDLNSLFSAISSAAEKETDAFRLAGMGQYLCDDWARLLDAEHKEFIAMADKVKAS